MGGYVIFTWFAMVAVIVFSGIGLGTLNCGGTNTTSAKINCIVAIIVAVIHSLVAAWIQRALLKECVRALDKEYDAKSVPHEHRDYDVSEGYHTRIRKATLEVIKYDIVFCLYFFFFPAAVGFAFWAMSPLPNCTAQDLWSSTWAYGILIFYGACAALYFFFLMCGVCCGAGKDTVKKQVKKGKAGVAGMTIGKV